MLGGMICGFCSSSRIVCRQNTSDFDPMYTSPLRSSGSSDTSPGNAALTCETPAIAEVACSSLIVSDTMFCDMRTSPYVSTSADLPGWAHFADRQSVRTGKRVSVRVGLGGRRYYTKKKKTKN